MNQYKKQMNALLDFFYPRRCPFCDAILKNKSQFVCEECAHKLVVIKSPFCMKCGKQLETQEKEYCLDCEGSYHYFERGRAIFPYHLVSKSMYRFKYAKRGEYAKAYGYLLSLYLKEEIELWNVDAIIPIPLHKKRYQKRGYNQAALIAMELGQIFSIPVYTNFLKRCKKTKPLKNLNHEERQNNLKKAFKLTRNDVELKIIILIDDIYTTGSTIDSAALELKRYGIDKVYFITVAIGDDYGVRRVTDER